MEYYNSNFDIYKYMSKCKNNVHTKKIVYEIFTLYYNDCLNDFKRNKHYYNKDPISIKLYFKRLEKQNFINILSNYINLYRKYLHTSKICSIYDLSNYEYSTNIHMDKYPCINFSEKESTKQSMYYVETNLTISSHNYFIVSILVDKYIENVDIFGFLSCDDCVYGNEYTQNSINYNLIKILKESNKIPSDKNFRKKNKRTIEYNKIVNINGRKYIQKFLSFPFYIHDVDKIEISIDSIYFNNRIDCNLFDINNHVLIETINIPKSELNNMNNKDSKILYLNNMCYNNYKNNEIIFNVSNNKVEKYIKGLSYCLNMM